MQARIVYPEVTDARMWPQPSAKTSSCCVTDVREAKSQVSGVAVLLVESGKHRALGASETCTSSGILPEASVSSSVKRE